MAAVPNTVIPATVPGPGGSLPLNLVQLQVNKIGNLSLLALRPVVTLSAAMQPLYTPVLSLGAGLMDLDFTIANNSSGWVAGTYFTGLTFEGMANNSKDLTITVPAFITPLLTVVPNAILAVTNASFFNTTTGGISGIHTIDYYTTLPSVIDISSTNKFAYNNIYNLVNPPQPNSSLLKATLTDGLSGPQINLSTTNARLTSSAIAVPTTNKKTVKTLFNLTGAQLKSDFVQAGTYTLPITYTVSKNDLSYPLSTPISATITSNINVVVSPFLNITAQTATVSLAINTAEKYKSGITTTVLKQLLINSTMPYDITVKATGVKFTSPVPGNTNTIDLDVLTIKGSGSPVTLSTTAATLISAANPQIAQELDMEYSIAPAKTTKLINKPAGTYTATITYTITAH